MLTAAQIEALRSHSEQLLDPLTDFLIEDIAKRVSKAGQFTATASYDAWKLQQLGVSQRKLKQEIAKRLEISLKDAEKLLTQAAKTGYNFDMSRFPTSQVIPLSANSSLQQILQATVEMAKDDLTNITQTIGFVGPDGQCHELTDAYNQACDFAFQKVSTGAQDYQSAIREATRNLAEKGIRTIDYESGVHTSIEAAVRRNIMGGLGIMQEKISESNHDALGCDGWEISAHGCCAPDHEPIQGKQFDDKTYKRINESLLRRIGTLNCGHAAFPIIFGVSEPVYSEEELEEFRKQNEEGVTFDGKHYTLYEATQRQRKFERTIRKQKRRILVDEATEDKAKLQTDQIKLVRLRQEYARFSKGVGLPMQHARMENAGFTWKHGKAAEKVAKEAERSAAEAARKKIELEKQREREYNERVEKVRQRIRSGEVPKELNRGHQQKHIKGSPGYIAGRSYIYGDLETAQNLVNTYHGTGTPVFKRDGQWSNKEIVLLDEVIGASIDPDTGEETETRRFVIHYGKKGTHVVPTKELKE